MKSKTAVLREFNAPLSLEEMDVPSLEPGEVLVKLEAAGVCGSDVHMWSGK
ncbi:alcohol dehydrogenase catalytic domain-containing protein, partial [Planctomycetota bacterium]